MGTADTAVLEVPDTAPLTATLMLDDATRARLRRAAAIVADANAYDIDCTETAEMANAELKAVKSRAKEIEAMETDFVAPAKLMLANAVKWFRPTKDALTEAERILKAKLVEWQGKEQARVAAEQKAIEDAARKARLEAEQKAAAERARQIEVERKAREEAAKAQAAKLEAQRKAEAARAAGDKEAAAKAEREAKAAAALQAKKEEQEQQAKAEADRKAREAELEADVRRQAAEEQSRAAAATSPALKGFGTADSWVTELDLDKAPTEADAIKLIAAALEKRPELIAVLKLDMVVARRMGTALNANFNIPGLKCTNQPKAVSRSK